jgi:hypothetical protein
MPLNESTELAPTKIGIAGLSGVGLGVGVAVASGVGAGDVDDFLTRRPDWAIAVSVQRRKNPAIAAVLNRD